MPIPSIASYPMPTRQELPASSAPWRPDPERAALLVHDMQRYFVEPFAVEGEQRRQLLHHIALLRDTADALGMPVLYTAQPGAMSRSERGLLHDLWGPGMTAEPEQRAIVEPIAPRDGDIVLTKWRYSAFARTGLRELLAQRRRDQLLVCGVYAHLGCLLTACDAFACDIEPFLVADAVADFSRADHQLALSYAARSCAVVLTAADAQQRLRGSDRPTVRRYQGDPFPDHLTGAAPGPAGGPRAGSRRGGT